MKYSLQDAFTAPALDNWAAFNIVEVETPDDFFIIPDHENEGEYSNDDTRGIICSIPHSFQIDQGAITQFYHAIRTHPSYKPKDMPGGDTMRHAAFLKSEFKKMGTLPEQLVALNKLAVDIYDRSFAKNNNRNPALFNRVDSTHHSQPYTHDPSVIITLDGDTTTMYATDNEQRIIGKKNLPPRSIAAFTGLHSSQHRQEPYADNSKLYILHT